MKHNGRIMATALAAVLSIGVMGAAMASGRTVIHFADLGGIKDWRPVGDDLFIEGTNGRWYRATFWGKCHQLRFSETIGFITEPTGELDKFSSIIAHGERCWFKTFERSEPPPRSRD